MFAALRSRLPIRLQRLALVLLGAAFFWSAGMLWVPWLLKPQAERAIGEALGRSAHIGKVEFRPWSLELTLQDVAIRTQDGAADQLHIAQVYANAALASVWRLAPVLDALQVSQPRLQLRQQSPGHYDIDDILARLSAPSDKPPGAPPKFALYNVALTDGAVNFQDDVVGRLHSLSALQLGLPFLSNLPADREVQTQPRLAFKINGSAFDSSAQSTPFLDSRKTAAHFAIRGLDVQPYLAYWPQGLPVKLQAGVLEADLALEFEQTPAASVVLRGQLGLHGLQLQDASGGELLQVERIALDVAELRPLQRVLRLASLEVDAPRLRVERDGAGRLNLLPATTATAGAAPVAEPVAPAPAWSVVLDKASLQGGSIAWRDQLAAPGGPPAELSVAQLTLALQYMAYPFAQPLRLQGSARIGGSATLRFEGSATDQAADLQATLDNAPLELGAPYLAAALRPRLKGDLSARLALAWKAEGSLMLHVEQLSVAQLALATAEPTEIRKLEVRDARVDVVNRSVDIGRVQVDRPRLALARDAQGRWMFEDWLVPARSEPAPAPVAAPWRVGLRALELDEGALAYADASTVRPVALAISALRLRTGPLQLDRRDRPVPVELSAAVAAGKTTPGRLSLRGQLALEPMELQADLDLQQLPLHALEPYFGDALNVRLQRADTSFKGSLRYAAQRGGPALRVAGDLGIDDLRAQQGAGGTAQAAIGRDLLTWNTLRLRGLALEMAPGAALTLAVNETALGDFYARVIVDEAGRINLQDLVKAAPEQATANAAPPGPSPNIRFGPIQVQGGRVLFSDRFVKPNYTANLTELQGRLSAFDSAGAAGGQPAMADLTLRGRAEGTASLEIEGKLNPLAKPLALDIRAKVRDLELPPLSPYSVKYAGHGIQRGKLSVDLHYEVLPNGQLTASNSLVLNQLTFGDPVPGAPASLPVRLAAALLADRHGVIDLNLPIQGSLNDPQFSIGPVILKILGNLILKAVTAPFSLLASAFGGGGEELGKVDFAPGVAALDKAAEQQLDKVARALTDRPGLKLSVIGTASPQAEREALKRARLGRMVQAEKRREVVAAGQPLPAQGVGAPPTEVGAEEYPSLLKSLYARAELADKPRSALGVAKELPVPEMEALLLADMQVSDESVRNLAVQRSVAVRDYLAAQQVPLERLFLGAPRTVASEKDWAPRAELELATP
ncbi:DUF748 domain-containing protein [Pseudorhodoferax sp. Leaf274]|uniref:DUF748 domain-containing protein n=1 Tax=Pseudorhodoferax sp. Leaf274 TaxID=1736318 RepID=UPI0007026D3A|nr:DUF748 domain-containing protein [Pseudorhodoferax sp. Leaf274]KQP35744.1 hypothetical protein ASF44_20760 [Pseudorhodoferax sp. Leaf274]